MVRVRLPAALLLTAVAASPRGGCGTGTGSPYDPCAGLTCGATCHLCAADATDCVEPAVLMACDGTGKCVVPGTGAACFEPCAGKVCGDACEPCAPGLPCPMTPYAYQCDGSGRCLATGSGTACEECAGKACGVQCAIEPACYPLCLMPALLGTCDGNGFCVAPGQVACPVAR